MADSFELTTVLPVTPEDLYQSWMSSEIHSAMTGTECSIDASVGGAFTASDGYITGTTTELQPNKRIVQAWRTSEFPDGAPDSVLELILEGVPEGTRLTLRHSNIPDGQGPDYKNGWQEHYFAPMQSYFE